MSTTKPVLKAINLSRKFKDFVNVPSHPSMLSARIQALSCEGSILLQNKCFAVLAPFPDRAQSHPTAIGTGPSQQKSG